ncbi:DNA cytosine methyltransferase [Pseudalkalibacillus sp. R45]|uniref:DNA cytosine methyltransferase n=1 Tax=Pseudalkalibacillus sp. R45 TaxID=3457433 RepID=UPI003FCE683A
MLKDKSLTYVTLFSSAGVGCYGFQSEDYHCIATNEIISRRMDVQRANNKCEYDTGYIDGDITSVDIKNKIYKEIDRWKEKGNDRVDVIFATPPCQGISVTNHKKNKKEIDRNSLVVESIEIVKNIRPRFFIFENVMAFQKTACITPDERVVPIGEYIREALGQDYIITGRIMNFMNYGSNSSRTRSLMIGVDKSYRNNITPYELYPNYRSEKTLRDVIFNLPRLEWGEINGADFYHAFRTYDSKMRDWIHDLKEGESAFDNEDPLKRPHRIVDGKIVENIRKNRDKYTRQPWDRFVQCVQTRNDQLAAQNTIHPEQDRVYSIRELMEMMTVPSDFRWVNLDFDELNNLPLKEKKELYKAHEMNIRQCLGEAVPTEIMRQIAHNIKDCLSRKRCEPININRIIADNSLVDRENLREFLTNNPLDLDVASLMRITELCNARRVENAAFYTNKFIVNEIMGSLPTFSKDEIRILEPSVGAGSFLPFLFKKYESVPHVILDVVDIDEASIETLNILLERTEIPQNFTINRICHDFLTLDISCRYDLSVGNPPFSKLKGRSPELEQHIAKNANKKTKNLSEMFLEKCMRHSDCVALVLNKTILSTGEFAETRDLLSKMRIDSIIDFGRYGFTGVSIETMCLVVYPRKKPKDTTVYSMKYNKRYIQKQSYITDKKYPYFIIYRDKEFDAVANKLDFDVFTVFRDRQITKSITSVTKGKDSLWVIKAKNINDDGLGVTHIEDYDVYLQKQAAESLSAYKFVNDTSVYLTPNMTYNPRVIENIPNTIADGSVAILIPKTLFRLTAKQKSFFSSKEYRRFYAIARNLSTQSINVDKTSVFFYGVLKDDI